MRLFLSGMVAAGMLTSQIAAAACVSSGDREALDVAGLKTQLMVQTLTCHTDDAVQCVYQPVQARAEQ